VVQKKIHKV